MVFRKRLIFWLIKAYLKKSGRTLAFFFIVGLFIFFGIVYLIQHISYIFPSQQKTSIGLVGAYTVDALPPIIHNKLSRGLTKVTVDGYIKPDIASKWDITNNGKTYTFALKDNIYFADGKKLQAKDITYQFRDVKIDRPTPYTIRFTLRDAYAPFLVTASRSIFKKGFVGTGDYRIEDIELNGDFVKSLKLLDVKNELKTEEYKFYPSEDALKIAFALGEVTKTIGLPDVLFKRQPFSSFNNVRIIKITDVSQVVAVFYNTHDPILSDKKVRTALSYALPDTFKQGERTYVPYPRNTWYYSADQLIRFQDFEHAKTLLEDAKKQASSSGKVTLQLKTLRKYRPTANIVSEHWKKIGIQTSIEEIDKVPDDFQVYVGDFTVPKDPDQYTLWHSDQENNITKFKNLRIDKLLEDGRKIQNMQERQKIYADLQKYLLDESPVSFLYFPYKYEINRR